MTRALLHADGSSGLGFAEQLKQSLGPRLAGHVTGLLVHGEGGRGVRARVGAPSAVKRDRRERDRFTLPVAGLSRELERLPMVPERCCQVPGLPRRRAERVVGVDLDPPLARLAAPRSAERNPDTQTWIAC